ADRFGRPCQSGSARIDCIPIRPANQPTFTLANTTSCVATIICQFTSCGEQPGFTDRTMAVSAGAAAHAGRYRTLVTASGRHRQPGSTGDPADAARQSAG